MKFLLNLKFILEQLSCSRRCIALAATLAAPRMKAKGVCAMCHGRVRTGKWLQQKKQATNLVASENMLLPNSQKKCVWLGRLHVRLLVAAVTGTAHNILN